MIRRILLCIALVLATLSTPLLARERVEIIVPTTPGAGPDAIARVLAEILDAEGYQAVVKNMAGAGGELGVRGLLRGSADTLTLLLTQSSVLMINPHVYDRAEKELWEHAPPVMFVGRSRANMLVTADGRITSIADLIAKKKKEGSPIRYGSNGVGSFPHLLLEEVLSRGGQTDRIHVAYKGAPEAIQGMLAGDVDLVISGTSALPLVTGGRLFPLAGVGDKPMPQMPSIPPLGREYKGLNFTPWFALLANAKVTPTQMQQLRRALRAGLSNSAYLERLATAGVETETMSETQLLSEMKREYEFFKTSVTRLKLGRIQ
jgi:tripartite-type tricarboxylate transporter receptor subunit TctC